MFFGSPEYPPWWISVSKTIDELEIICLLIFKRWYVLGLTLFSWSIVKNQCPVDLKHDSVYEVLRRQLRSRWGFKSSLRKLWSRLFSSRILSAEPGSISQDVNKIIWLKRSQINWINQSVYFLRKNVSITTEIDR